MKKANYLTVAILNMLAAICFLTAMFLSDKATMSYGLLIVAVLFGINGIANLIKHYKRK